MTTGTRAFEEPVAPSRSAARALAPAGEFLAVGGATLVLLPVLWLLRRALGLDSAEFAVGFLTFYGAYVVNDPHFSVTYLLFYKDVRKRAFGAEFSRAQRLRYVVAGAIVPAVLLGWAAYAFAAHSAQALGWMVQAMFALVGWHYVKQGFGVLSVLSARRGVRFSARERAIVLFHCYAGWAFAWANPAMRAGEFEEKGVVYWAPAHPHWFEVACGAVLAASTVALVVVLVMKWRRERAPLPFAPLAGLLVTVWSWTIFRAWIRSFAT